MRIESQSLAAYLFGNGIGHRELSSERIWRDILRFPGESWSPTDESDEESILDPGRVLGRMFCVKMDRYLLHHLHRGRISNKQMGITVPLSWLLRLAPDESWAPGDVLLYAEKKSSGFLNEDIREIRKFFPKLFSHLRDKDEEKSCLKRLDGLFVEKWEEFKGRELIHISAPKFHKSWTKLVGEDREKQKDAVKAKQQWSMSVDGYFEKLCLASEGGSKVIQSGGGHVLLLAPKDSVPGDVAEKELKFIRKEFVALDKRGWSPLLWASWDPNHGKGSKGYHVLDSQMEIDVEKLVSELCRKYEESERARFSVKENWAFFKYGTESNTERKTDKPAIIYLDVIGLGEHCWPKNEEEQENGNPPYRKRQAAIDGFIKSRNITAVIESTFGLIFAKHLPGKVLAMGGDEIIMEMDASEWLGVVLNIEEHCKKLHATIFDEDARLLWWAMCSEGDSAPDSDIIDKLKNEYRKLTDIKRVQLMRFVNPMWTSIGQVSEEEIWNLPEEKPLFQDKDSDLTVDKLTDDLFDISQVPMFDAGLRADSMSSGKDGDGESISSDKIWRILIEDISKWEKEEYGKLSDDQKNQHRGNLVAWTTVLDESCKKAWNRTSWNSRPSKKINRMLRKIACCFLTRKYGMKSSDYKTWKT